MVVGNPGIEMPVPRVMFPRLCSQNYTNRWSAWHHRLLEHTPYFAQYREYRAHRRHCLGLIGPLNNTKLFGQCYRSQDPLLKAVVETLSRLFFLSAESLYWPNKMNPENHQSCRKSCRRRWWSHRKTKHNVVSIYSKMCQVYEPSSLCCSVWIDSASNGGPTIYYKQLSQLHVLVLLPLIFRL
jgi:hypothetical protein